MQTFRCNMEKHGFPSIIHHSLHRPEKHFRALFPLLGTNILYDTPKHSDTKRNKKKTGHDT